MTGIMTVADFHKFRDLHPSKADELLAWMNELTGDRQVLALAYQWGEIKVEVIQPNEKGAPIASRSLTPDGQIAAHVVTDVIVFYAHDHPSPPYWVGGFADSGIYSTWSLEAGFTQTARVPLP